MNGGFWEKLFWLLFGLVMALIVSVIALFWLT
jgi:hypothetical protein